MSWYKMASTDKDGVLKSIKEEDWKEYKKTATIEVGFDKDLAIEEGVLDKDGYVDTLEGKQKFKDGDVFCKGIDDEIYIQPKKRLEEKYIKSGTLKCSHCLWVQVWKPKGSVVEAVQIDFKDEFKVKTMNGKKNDWILRDKNNKDDAWIVQNDIFKKTYKLV